MAQKITDFLVLNLGIFLTALGLDLFLVPNKIAAGGVGGIATIIFHLVGFPVGLTMLALNVPLFIWGIYRLGWAFGVRSLYGTIVLSAAVDLLALVVPVPTQDLLLSSLFGGVLVGLGLGLVFRSKSTTGGTDFAAAILRSYVGINVGQLLFIIDGLVVLAAWAAFGSPDLAMYALITIFVGAWIIDVVQEGFGFAKSFLIISEHPDRIAKEIFQRLDRGATVLMGRGAYTGQERQVLLTVVNRSEVTRLKDVVHEVDPRAFVIVSDVKEVLGEGFKRLREVE
ncbi:MAG: YitT family protein [Peptococcaceae bacterium]|nr:YitT family protein [Peptococcaceae bacterium]